MTTTETAVAITYRPAAARFEAYAAQIGEVRAQYLRIERVHLMALTKAQLMATGDVMLHESYAKAELVNDAAKQRWNKTEKAQEYDRLMHLESRESEIVDQVEKSQEKLVQAFLAISATGQSLDDLNRAMDRLNRYEAEANLWKQVAELTGPDGHEPLDAIRVVAHFATQKALDDLEDNSRDLLPARVAARWIRRNEHLITALDTYK